MMHPKKMGTIGEAQALAKFIKLGIPVYLPFGDNEKADMIIDLKGSLKKIQVKTAEKISKDGTFILFSIKYTANNRKNIKGKYTSNDIDYFLLYSLQLDEFYLVPIEDAMGKESFTIRLQDTDKSLKTKVIHYRDDYLLENILNT